ncbi:MAG: SPFH domain-containing protein [Thermoanaerobaculia bacterium]
MNEPELTQPRHVVRIRAAAAALYRRRRIGALASLLLALLVLMASGIRVVRNDERGLRRRLGKLVDGRVSPGATFAIPLMEEFEVVAVGAVRSLPLNRRETETLEFITGDENLVEISGQLQYRIEDAGLFRTAQYDPNGVLLDSAIAALAREISILPVDEVLTTGKSALQEAVRSAAQAAAEQTRTGIVLLQVSLAAVSPPAEAAGAFNAVSDAAAWRERRVSEAQGKASQALSLARAQAETDVRQAESRNKEITEAARAERQTFLAIADQVARSPAAGRARLYRASLSKVFATARVVVIPATASKSQIQFFLGRFPAGSDDTAKSFSSLLGKLRPEAERSSEIAPPQNVEPSISGPVQPLAPPPIEERR